MASKTAILSVRVVTDAKEGTKGLEDAATGVERFQQRVDRATPAAAAAAAGVALLGKTAIDAASAAQQAGGAVETVFKQHAATIKGYADAADQTVGLAEAQYAQLAAVLGSQLKNLGIPLDNLAGQTDQLITLGADLAATYGGTTADAVAALSATLRGEMDPIEAYGVSLSDAVIEAEKAAQGMSGLSGEADKNADLMATLAIISRQTADAQGQFAQEADTAAGAQERATAAAEDAQAKIGSGLLPVYTELMTRLGGVATFLGQNQTATLAVLGVIAALAAAVLVVNAALQAYAAVQAIVRGATVAWTAVQWALNAALSANPIGLVIIAVAALIAGILWLWNENEGFRNFVIAAWAAIAKAATVAWDWIVDKVTAAIDWIKRVIEIHRLVVLYAWNQIRTTAGAAWDWITDKVTGVVEHISAVLGFYRDTAVAVWNFIRDAAVTAWNNLRDGAKSALDTILTPIRAVQDAFNTLWSIVQSVINAIRRIVFPSLPGWLRPSSGGGFSLFSMAAPEDGDAMKAAAIEAETMTAELITPSAFAPASASGFLAAGAGTTINVTVNGALDPVAVGRQLEDVLGKYLRRTGRRSLGQAAL